MNQATHAASPNAPRLTNGSAAAAILSAGTGCFALALLALAGDKSAKIAGVFVFYKPTGPLSGVTTTALAIWLFTWGILEWRWRNRTVALPRISVTALALLGLSLLLTFPPIVHLL